MDEIAFHTFLRNQEAALTAIDLKLAPPPDAIRSESTRVTDLSLDLSTQAQVDQLAHLMVEAYLVGSTDQRNAIRQMLNGLGAVRLHLRIPASQIRSKIDAVRFRLALLIESIKDLGPDPEEAVDRVDQLCRAAKNAQIDRNPILREVAALSSSINVYGVGSMRGHLLARVVTQPGIRCDQCGKNFNEALPTCTHCGVPNPTYLHTHVNAIGEEGDAVGLVSATETYIFLPTLDLLIYVGWMMIAGAFVLIAFALALNAWLNPTFFQSWKGWTLAGIDIALYALLRYFRVAQLFARYAGKSGNRRVDLTNLQSWLLVAVFAGIGSFVAVVCIVISTWLNRN